MLVWSAAIRNLKSPHSRPWLGAESRCLVPFTSFSLKMRCDGRLAAVRVVRAWRGSTDGLLCRDLDAVDVGAEAERGRGHCGPVRFLTTEPNAVVGPIHPRAMPVILTKPAECDMWLPAPIARR